MPRTSFASRSSLLVAGGIAAGDRTLRDTVTVIKDDAGNTVVYETIDPSPGRSALSGAMWAGLFGLILGGPVGWVGGLAVGTGAGAVTAKVVDLGISDEFVAWFRDAVTPGTAAVALLVEDVIASPSSPRRPASPAPSSSTPISPIAPLTRSRRRSRRTRDLRHAHLNPVARDPSTASGDPTAPAHPTALRISWSSRSKARGRSTPTISMLNPAEPHPFDSVRSQPPHIFLLH